MTTPDARTPTTPHITPHTPLPSCIIRSTFLGAIKEAYDADPSLSNLLLAPYFVELVGRCQAGWRAVVSQAALLGVPEWRPFVTTLRPNRFDNTEVRRAKSIIG